MYVTLKHSKKMCIQNYILSIITFIKFKDCKKRLILVITWAMVNIKLNVQTILYFLGPIMPHIIIMYFKPHNMKFNFCNHRHL